MLRIECFHRVLPENLRDEQWPYFTRGTAMTVDAFTHYIDTLSREYEFVDEKEAHSLLTSAGSSRRACWVTFDDGYLDNLRFAAPVLARFGVRPTLFMTKTLMCTMQVRQKFNIPERKKLAASRMRCCLDGSDGSK